MLKAKNLLFSLESLFQILIAINLKLSLFFLSKVLISDFNSNKSELFLSFFLQIFLNKGYIKSLSWNHKHEHPSSFCTGTPLVLCLYPKPLVLAIYISMCIILVINLWFYLLTESYIF